MTSLPNTSAPLPFMRPLGRHPALLVASIWLYGCSEAPASLQPVPGVAQAALGEAHLAPAGTVAANPTSPGDNFGFEVGVVLPWLVSAQFDAITTEVRVSRSQLVGDSWTDAAQLLPVGVSANRWLEPFIDATLSPNGQAQALVGTGQVDGSVLTFDLATGEQRARVVSPSPNAQRFGSALKAHGSWLAVGDYLDGPTGTEQGAVHLFEREADGWVFRQSVTPTPSVARSNFGQALALSEHYVAIGAPRADTGASNLGAVHVYHLEQGAWVHQQTLLPDVILADTRFGRTIALTDEQLVVSAPGDSSFTAQGGAVYVFQRSGASWTVETKLGPQASFAGYGVALALGGKLLAIGAHGDIGDPNGDPRGYVDTFYKTELGWEPLQMLPSDTAHNASVSARYGHGLATDGTLLAVGVPDVSGGTAAGKVYTHLLEETLELAAACADNEQCKSGQCVDGVCCDSACDGVCEACTSAKRGQGADGACGPIIKGQDPDAECPSNPSAGNACEEVSACSGAASCDCVVSGTLQCVSETERVNELGETVSCVPYRCSANTCLGVCSSSADCSPGATCNSERRCVLGGQSTAAAGDDSGCTLGSARPRQPDSGALAWLAGAWLLFVARRRKAGLSA